MRRFGFVFSLATLASTLMVLFAAVSVFADAWPPTH
jgi:hypothetical protein